MSANGRFGGYPPSKSTVHISTLRGVYGIKGGREGGGEGG